MLGSNTDCPGPGCMVAPKGVWVTKPQILNLQPNPSPLNPKHETLNPKRETLNPKPAEQRLPKGVWALGFRVSGLEVEAGGHGLGCICRARD